MDTGFLNRISKLLSPEKLAFRKKTIIFSFFLLVSIVMWLMNYLSKDYITEIEYPVRFKNYPQNRTLIGEIPSVLSLKVSSHGYTLLWNRVNRRQIPVIININSFALSRLSGKDSSFYYLETRYIHEYIERQLDVGIRIIDVKPDTLIFPFALVKTKMVPVFADIEYELDKQLIIKGLPSIHPDSVLVSGPDYIIDTLSIIRTEKTDLGTINSSIEKELVLKKHKHINFETHIVQLEFEIEKFTEKTLNVPISVVNLPDSLELKLFPRNIQLTCQVGLSNFDHLQSGMFTASVDYYDIISGISRLQVNLVNQPRFIRAVKYKPKTVEFLIEK